MTNSYKFNKGDIEKLNLKNNENNNYIFKSISIFLTIILLIVITTALINTMEQKKKNEVLVNEIKEVKIENILLKKNNEINRKTIENYQRTNTDLINRLKNSKSHV